MVVVLHRTGSWWLVWWLVGSVEVPFTVVSGASASAGSFDDGDGSGAPPGTEACCVAADEEPEGRVGEESAACREEGDCPIFRSRASQCSFFTRYIWKKLDGAGCPFQPRSWRVLGFVRRTRRTRKSERGEEEERHCILIYLRPLFPQASKQVSTRCYDSMRANPTNTSTFRE